MKKVVVTEEKLFEVVDVFGKKIRTTKEYWRKIKEAKHTELKFDVDEIIETIENPDEVYRGLSDETIFISYRWVENRISLVVVTKHLNGDGFLVTAYQTTKDNRKGEKLWPVN